MGVAITQFLGSNLISNCYIVVDVEISNKCVIIDPGAEDISAYVNCIEEKGLEHEYIIITHRHYDHFAGANDLQSKYPSARLYCSTGCNIAIQDARLNCSIFKNNHRTITLDPAEVAFDSYYAFMWNGHRVECVPTPGHTADSISILIEDNVFTGDALLKDLPTVTKLPSGNKEQQKDTEIYLKSLHGYKAWPGHGEAFVIV